MKELKDTLKLLIKPNWNYSDVMNYCGVKKTKSYEIMALAKKHYNGTIPALPSYVRRDSVLGLLGTSIERETYINNHIKKEEKV